MEHQFHYGKKFYLDKENGYWISTTCPKVRAHVWVWKHHYGCLKKGFHIHHKDGNKSNNDIENLEMISAHDHLSLHMNTEENKRRARELVNIIRPLTKEWHASEEGRKWHTENGIKCWEERKPFEIVCKQCGRISITKTYHQEFCSNSCKSKWRRLNKIDNEDRQCPVCNCTYSRNKYSKVKTCGKKCGKLFKNKIN